MARHSSTVIAALVVVVSSSVPSVVRAQAAGDPGRAAPESTAGFAEALFDASVKLMQAGNYAEACPKLAESHRLDPASGTVYNLAICLEKEGKNASAAIAFEETLSRSIKDGNKERESLARERLARLKEQVARVVVRIGPKVAALDAVDVRFDGASVRRQAWGIEVPMDPGVHVLTVVAPGKREAKREVDVNAPGKVFELAIDALEDEPASRLPLFPTAKEAPREVADTNRRVVGFGLLGLGGLLVVGGGVSGALAFSRHAETERICASAVGCNADARSAEAAANGFAWGANIGIALGVVSAAIGTYLLVTTKSAPRVTAAPRGLAFVF